MGVTNRDASQIAKNKQQMVLSGWKSANDVQVSLGRSVLQEQPTYQSSRVVVDRQQGCFKCTLAASANPYQFNGLSQCGCGAAQ
jgi:hypothetical protein